MKTKKIFYKKLFDLGGYQNEVVGIEIEVEPGETAFDAMEEARLFVESRGDPLTYKYLRCKSIIKAPEKYTEAEVKEAKEYIDKDAEENPPF